MVLEAVRRNGLELRFAAPKLQDDREVVLAACAQNGGALVAASKQLRADKQVVSEIMKTIVYPSSILPKFTFFYFFKIRHTLKLSNFSFHVLESLRVQFHEWYSSERTYTVILRTRPRALLFHVYIYSRCWWRLVDGRTPFASRPKTSKPTKKWCSLPRLKTAACCSSQALAYGTTAPSCCSAAAKTGGPWSLRPQGYRRTPWCAWLPCENDLLVCDSRALRCGRMQSLCSALHAG
jgi:hypothetical protein